MKTILSIFLVLSLFNCFSQDSIVSKKIENIEFKNILDQLSQENTYEKTKKLIGSPDSSKYFWESFDFGGPRIFRHFWTAYYGQINAEIRFTKITVRRSLKIWRPIRGNAQLTSITITSGSFNIDTNTLTIGSTQHDNLVNILKGYSIVNAMPDFIDIVEENLKVEFYFNEKKLLEKIKYSP